jgi:NAD(P)-dependent dehydrogenase (short-subunit alcohol dehydrogenase family)
VARSIFITGGGSGIGRAAAVLFARRGWRVGLGDVSDGGMAETLALLGREDASAHRLDVRDRVQWAEVLAAFAGETGRIDVLFNNAGIAVGGPLVETPESEIDRILAINLAGVVHGARAAYPYLKAAAPGSALVNTASAAGIYGVGGGAIYSATKFAVRGLTESLDVEWAADGIRVRSIMPGFIDTPLLDAVPAGSNQNTRERVRASGLEFTPVEQVAEAVWAAVHGERVHVLVGKTARRLAFAARWMPGRLRRDLVGRNAL